MQRREMAGEWEVPAEIRELEGDYHLIGELGRGGMAVVYLARDRALGRSVAVKVIRAKYVEDAEAMARFAREARTAAQLQHPNIVTLFAVRKLESQGLALVMQYVPGLTLKALIQRQGPLPVDRVEQVLRDVGAALSYAHRHGVIHRDVKPENIFIDEVTGRALLSDFGAALSQEHDTGLTLVGTAIGTPAYMSPEQIDGGEIDDRSDLYSLCLVGWEMLTATRPWSGSSLYSIIYRQKHEELPPADAGRSDVPAGLLYAIEGGLCKDRQERWGSVQEFVGKLSVGAGSAEVRRWKKRRRTARVAALPDDTPPDGIDPVTETPTVTYRRPHATDPADAAAVAAIPVPEPVDYAGYTDPAPEPGRRRRAPLLVAALVLVAAMVGGALWLLPPFREAGAGPPVVAVSDAPVTTSVPVDAPRADTATATASQDTAPASAVAGTDSAAADAAPVDSAADSATAPRTADPATPDAPRSGLVAARATAPVVPPPARVDSSPVRPPAAAVDTAAAPAPPPVRAAAPVPTSGPPLVATSNTVVAGGAHSCLLTTAGELSCWGSNDHGQLGTGGGVRAVAPVRVAPDLRVRELSLGASHSCALARDGTLACWGSNDQGQLGDGSTADRAAPTRVAGERAYRAVSAGRYFTCAVSSGGDAYCWGANAAGQLGDGTRTRHEAPTRVGGGIRFSTVAAGWQHACALDTDGRAYCWGENGNGQLGIGGSGGRTTPTPVAGDLRFARIAAGSAHTCAVTRSGEAHCWGRNNYGQLGTGQPGDEHAAPTPVQSGERFASIAAGTVHSCALNFAGAAFCWGRNTYGQLGDGSQTDRALPVPVAGGGVFTRLNASGAHTCGATTAGAGLCWGYNVEGQLGDGTLSHRSRPRAVSRTN